MSILVHHLHHYFQLNRRYFSKTHNWLIDLQQKQIADRNKIVQSSPSLYTGNGSFVRSRSVRRRRAEITVDLVLSPRSSQMLSLLSIVSLSKHGIVKVPFKPNHTVFSLNGENEDIDISCYIHMHYS